MPEIGQSVSHYRIIEKLGAGGMGVVYRAEDTTLGRQVAIKVLPEAFAGDPERMAHFEREAKLLASLNHSNIAAIHGLEEADGKRFIVMELAEGETLARRISRGPLPVDEALEVCRQIAEGLEAAHEKGVIHRDLKPSNVMVSAEGKVKILDFGLARALAGEVIVADPSHSPTITETMTRPGVVLGTAAYLSPEQAKGKVVDKRADIWAFGCILYESLTGRRPFQGETVTETLAVVIRGEPDWTLLPADTPSEVRSALRRCLRKDVSTRFRDVADVRLEMLDSAPQVSVIQEVVGRKSLLWRTLPWVVAAAIAIIAVALVVHELLLPEPQPPKPLHFSITLPVPIAPLANNSSCLAISSDGQQLAYVGGSLPNTHLYYRRLDVPDMEIGQIPRLEGISNPFFSPDGKWLAFNSDQILKMVPVAGGPVVDLFDQSQSFAGHPAD